MIRPFLARFLVAVLGCAVGSPRALADDHVWTTGGPEGASVYQLAVDPSAPGTIYAVSRRGVATAIFKSTDGGASWTSVYANEFFHDVQSVTFDSTAPATVYAVGFDLLMKSVDGGESWMRMNAGLPVLALNVLAIDPQSPATLYVGANIDGIFKSSDGGANWSAVSTGLPRVAGFGGPLIPSVSALAIDPENPRTLYAGFSSEQGVFKSTDAGSHWNPVNEGLNTAFQVDALVIDPSNSSRLYAISSGIVHKTDDGGAHWRYANAGVNTNVLLCLALNPAIPTTLYLGAGQYGLYRSVDGAENWSPFNDGLLNLTILSLAVAPAGVAVHAGTWEDGVFDLDLRPDRLPILGLPARPRLPTGLEPRL